MSKHFLHADNLRMGNSPIATKVSHSRWSTLTYLLPLIIPGLVIATYVFFYRSFLFCSDKDATCGPLSAATILAAVSSADGTRVASYVARASWTLVNGIHLLACVVGIVGAVMIIYHALQTDREKPFLLMLLVFLFAADVALLMALLTNTDAYSPAQQLLRATVDQVLPAIRINKLTRIFDTFSLTATLCLACAACAIVWQRHDEEQDENELARRMGLLRHVLYIGAALLAVGVLRVSATLGWGASFIPADTEPGKAVLVLVSGIVGSLGVSFTLLIAAVYLPAALILRARATKLASKQPLEGRQTWLTERGLALSVSQYVPRFVALISPLLVGPVGELLIRLPKALT